MPGSGGIIMTTSGARMSDPLHSQKMSDPLHSQKLLVVLRSFWQQQCFHDALLVVDGEELPVQKTILAAASPYIRAKLNYNPPKEDGSTYRIELQEVSMPIMKEILDYIFSGEISLSEDTIQDMVKASDVLLLTHLKSLCCQFLESCITAENCIGIRLFSLHYCLHHVHHVATEYLQTHFRDVALTQEFRELPPEQLREVLAMERLNVGNEREVLEAAVRWFTVDPEDRRLHLKEVMSAVWWKGLDASYLREQDTGEPLMREVIRDHLQPTTEDLLPWKQRGYSECIVVAGGVELNGKPVATVRCICPLNEPSRRAWIELQPMSTGRVGHGAVVADGYVFVMGGMEEHGTVLETGEKYDPDSNTWSPISPMIQARKNFGVAELDGRIYVMGGDKNNETHLRTVEVFDPYCNTWKQQTSMNMVRKLGCYATVNKKIYAVGGGHFGKEYDSVECFDPKTQQWTSIRPLRHRRWKYLDDQNLYFKTDTSILYGAVPIGASVFIVGNLDCSQFSKRDFDYIREFRHSTGTWHHTKPWLSSDLDSTSCSGTALRIANWRLFLMQMKQQILSHCHTELEDRHAYPL